MPIYEYLCQKCGHKFEKIQKFSDRLIKKCPECGGPVEQTITAPAVQFKGTGWYVTDYASKDKKEKTSSGAKESSASSDKDESHGSSKEKTDAKESKESKDSKDSKESSSSKESKDSKDTKESKTIKPGSKKR